MRSQTSHESHEQEHPDRLLALMDGFPSLFHGERPTVASHVPAGWFHIIERLCRQIDDVLLDGLHFEVIQVKEKWGSLRFYFSLEKTGHTSSSPIARVDAPTRMLSDDDVESVRQQIRAAMDEAESKSLLTCMACGAPGLMRYFVRLGRGEGRAYYTEGEVMPSEPGSMFSWQSVFCDRHAEERAPHFR